MELRINNPWGNWLPETFPFPARLALAHQGQPQLPLAWHHLGDSE